MDSLSFGNIKKTEAKNRVSFTGQKSTIEATGTRRHSFYVPPFNRVVKDENGEHHYGLALEITAVEPEKDKKGFPTGKLVTTGEPVLLTKSIFPLSTKGIFSLDEDNVALPDTDMVGYRFVIVDEDKLKAEKNLNNALTGEYLLDVGNAAEGANGKYSYFSKRQGFVNKIGPMLHSFVDANHVDDKTLDKEGFARNAFNKAGGNIQGMIKELNKPNGEYSAYEMIMTTPLFGGDDISSHGYWTMNPFQISSTKGTLQDFKDLQVAMFDNNKAYVTDGAFTSFSMESPQLQSFFKWGKQSPFYNWVKYDTTDAPNGKVSVGILPDAIVESSNERNSYDSVKAKLIKENTGFKVVNPKYIESDGKSRLTLTEEEMYDLCESGNTEIGASVVKNPYYDPKKPTYIQFIDKRLASTKQCEDTENLIFQYDKATAKNHYDITDHQDSIQPFYFQVDPEDNRFKTKGTTLKFIEELGYLDNDGSKTKRKGYDAFFQMDHYSITTKGQVGGVNSWDGQTDLFKANISNPSGDVKNIIGNKQVKNYYYNIATYWTKTTDSALMEHIASGIAKNQDKTLENISEKYSINKNVLEGITDRVIHTAEFEKNFQKKIASVTSSETITNSLINFPLESVTFAPDLTATLSSSFVTPRPLNELDDETASKPELLKKMPQDVQNLYNKHMLGYVLNVLSALNEKMPADKKIFENQNIAELTDYGRVVVEIIIPDIMSYGIVKSLFPDEEIEFDKNGTPVFDESLRQKGLNSVGLDNCPTPEIEAERLISKMSEGFDRITSTDNKELVTSFYERFSDISLDNIKAARAIIDKTGAGLNWRFDAAKDVADLDQRRAKNPNVKTEDCLNSMIDFWGNFIKNIRKENDASFIILELTDLWSFSRHQHGNLNKKADELINEFENLQPLAQKRVITMFFKRDVQKIYNNPENGDSRAILDTMSEEAKDFIHGKGTMTDEIYKELKEYYLGKKDLKIPDGYGGLKDVNSKDLLIDAVSNEDFGRFVNPNIAERMIYDETGATTGSNYSTFYGLLPNLFGQDFEYGTTDNWKLHNMEAFEQEVTKFFKSASPQFINKSHIFINNHDKPRPFHCMSLDMQLFLGDLKSREDKARAKAVTGEDNFDQMSSMGIAVGEKYLEVFPKAIEELRKEGINLTKDEENVIKHAIGDLAAGKFMGGIPNMYTSRTFGHSPFDVTMKDVMQQARFIAKSEGFNNWRLGGDKEPDDKQMSEMEQKLIDKAFSQFEPELDKLASLLKLMMCTVGIPALFAGDEMAHSGYETATKNLLLSIRNIVHHSWLSDEGKKFVQDFNKKVTAAAMLHKEKGMTALADGFPLVVPQGTKDRTALYKYNEKGSGVLIVYSNKTLENGGNDDKERARKPLNDKVSDVVPSINLGCIDPQQGDKVVANAAPEGTLFEKLVYNPEKGKYEAEAGKLYIANGNGELVSASIYDEKGNKLPKPIVMDVKDSKIKLDDVATVFRKVS